MEGVCLSMIFSKNFDAYRAGAKIIINSGGQGSSKTFSILQLLYMIAKYPQISRDGLPKKITIASYALPHLKMGAMLDLDKVISSFGDNPLLHREVCY
jgi:phage terminase large subunit